MDTAALNSNYPAARTFHVVKIVLKLLASRCRDFPSTSLRKERLLQPIIVYPPAVAPQRRKDARCGVARRVGRRARADPCHRSNQRTETVEGPAMKKPLLSIEEPEPKKAVRADRPPTEGFATVVDGHFKSEFDTAEAAEAAGRKLKSAYPYLQIEIYDSALKVRTLLS
jgi:hypothetical protein